MQQCMLGAIDEFCTMLVPSMHCRVLAMDEFCTMLVPSMHCSFIFFLMVTIVEVHKLILDVCVSLSATIDENFLWTNCLESPLY